MNELDDLLTRFKQEDAGQDIQEAPANSDLLNRYKQEDAVLNAFAGAAKTNPDEYARLRKKALDAGMTPEQVDMFPEEAERRARYDQAVKLAQDSPKTAKWLADGENARLGHDNADNLSGIEQAFSVLKNTGSAAVSGLRSASAGSVGLFRMPFELAAPLAQPLVGTVLPANPFGLAAEGLADWQRSISGRAKAEMPKSDTVGGAGFYSGVASLTRNLAALPMAFLPGGQKAALGAMVAPVGGEAFGEARDQGKGLGASLSYAGSQAAIEYATEKLPVSWLVKDVKAGETFLKVLGKQMLAEVPGEQIATVLQDLNDWAVLPENQDKAFSDYLAERPNAAAQTLIATLVGTGGQVSVIKGVDMVLNRAERAQQAEQKAAFLDNLNKLAASDKLLQRDADSFEAFVAAAAEDGPVDTVFVDGRMLMQSGMAPKLAEMSPAVREQLDRAILTGGDIAIPVAEYAARIAPTDLAPQLLDHLKTEAEGFTRAEAQDFMANQGAELQAEVERILTDRQDADTFRASQDVVKQDILGQLNTAGRFTPQVNEAYATLASAYSAVRAAQLGMTPEAFHAERGMRVQGAAVVGDKFDQGSAEETIRSAFEGLPSVSLGVAYPITVEFNGRQQQFMARQDALKGRNPRAAINLIHLKRGRMIQGGPEQWIAQEYKLDGKNNLKPSGMPKPFSDEEAAQFNANFPQQLNQSAPIQTNTPAFKAWFGDSKVRDADGKPLVVYHGTTADIEQFRQNKATEKDAGWYGTGIYMTADPNTASAYSGYEEMQGRELSGAPRVMPLYVSLQNPYVWPKGRAAATTPEEAAAIRAELEAAGHDGVLVPNEYADPEYAGHYEVIAFRPEQIKSAIGNRGTFDPADPNILNQSAWYPDANRELAITDLDEPFSGKGVAKQAEAYYKETLQGSTVNNAAVGDVTFSADGLGKLLSSGRHNELRASVVKVLPGLIRNGDLIGAALDEKGRGAVDGFRYLIAPMRHNGQLYAVQITLKQAGGTTKLYTVEGFSAKTVAAILGPDSSAHASELNPGPGTASPNPSSVRVGDLLSEVNEYNRYFQPDGDTNRGAFSPATNTVTLLQNADLSTFLHESAHYFFESDIQLASELLGKESLTSGEQQIVDDVGRLLTWHGIQGDVTEQLRQWHTMDFEEQRSHHERTAESFEAYLFSGKAPSLELQPIFQRFAAWMVNVYKSLKDFLTRNPEAGKLNDEVRSVFDRMIATQDEIALAEKARSMLPLFASPETSGMTPDAFAAYQALGVDATNEAIQELQAKGLRDLQWLANAKGRQVSRLKREARALRAEVEIEARREVMAQPVYRAWQFLTGKPSEKTEAQTENEREVADWKQRRQEAMDAAREQAKKDAWDNSEESKQDYDSGRAKGMAKGQFLARNKKDIDLVVARAALDWDRSNPKPAAEQDSNVFDLGEQVFGKINRAALEDIGVPEEITAHIRKLRMTAADGMHPDQVAEMFDFSSGDEMVRALAAVPSPKEAITALADRLMLERHGELATPEAIEQAADAAIHNDARARFVATEYNALAQATGKPRILAAAAKEYAAAMIARLKVRDIKPGQYANAETRAAKAAAKAEKAGDLATAAAEKRNQVINTYATKAAYDAQDEVKATLRAWSKLVARKDSTKSVDIDLLNAVRAILGEYGIAPKRAERASEYLKSVQAYDPEMYAVIQASVERAEANAKPVKDLTLEELRGLRDEIDAIMHLAKRSRQMEVDGNLLDIEDIQGELLGRMQEYGIPDKIPGEGQAVTPAEQRMTKLKSLLAFARRVESWVGQMDGKEQMGPFRRFVWSRISDAAVAYRTDKADYLKRFRGLVESIAPTLKPMLIHAPELGYTFGKDSGGSAVNEILHAILHTGNESNKRKMLLGRGWAVEVAPGQLDTTRWDAFIARMVQEGKITQAHYDFAQGVWDLLDSMKPLAQKTHRDVFGKYFAEVTAAPFTDPFGVTRAGGYVPAMVDSRVVKDAELRKLADEDNAAMSYAFPTTPKGFTQARTEYNKPLMLDLRTLGQHIDKVLLFSHMEMPVRDVQRVLSKQVGETLNRIDQTAISGMLLPWLNRSAKQQVETPIAGSAGTMRFFSVMRSRAGMAAMFGNLANTVQQLTGFSLAAVKVKPGLLLAATADFIKSPREFSRSVAESSPYMNTRMANEVHAMTDAINDILLNPSLLEKGQAWTMRHAYFLQSAMDNSMSPIIWTAAYNQAVQNGADHDDAVRLADGTVRQTQGAMQAEDISRIEGGNAFVRMFTQFAGYFNMNANLLGTEYVKLMHDGGLRKNAGRGVFLFLLGYYVPAIVGEIIIQAFRGGPGDDDDDGEYLDDWIAAVFGWAPLRYATAMVPVGGQAVNAAVNATNSKPYDDRLATSPAISMLESAARAPVSVFKAVEGDGSAQKAVRDVATLMAMTLGIPASLAARPLGYGAGVMDEAIDPTGGFDFARGMLTGQVSPDSKL